MTFVGIICLKFLFCDKKPHFSFNYYTNSALDFFYNVLPIILIFFDASFVQL